MPTFRFSLEGNVVVKEVEKIDALEDLTSSPSIKGEDFPDYKMLDARIASGLNKIFQNPFFKKKISLEEQKAHTRKTDRSHDQRLLQG